MPQCNGAGEMPGQEGRDSVNEDYQAYLDHNVDTILEAWAEHITDKGCLDDIPGWFLNQQYAKGRE